MGYEKSRLTAVAAIARLTCRLFLLFMDRPRSRKDHTKAWGSPDPHATFCSRDALWNRHRTRQRIDSTDSRRARRKWRSRDERLVTLSPGRTTRHANTCKGIAVGVRSRETIRECSQEDDDQVLLVIRQAETTDRHVEIVRDLRRRPAIYFFGLSCRAVSRRDVEWVHVARVVEVDELLQALDVAVMKEPLLEVRPWRLGSGTL